MSARGSLDRVQLGGGLRVNCTPGPAAAPATPRFPRWVGATGPGCSVVVVYGAPFPLQSSVNCSV